MSENPVFVASALASMILWTTSYALIIRRSHLDRTWGVPFPSLCLNLAYELVFGFVHPLPAPAHYVNIVWFLVDLLIFSQFLRHGRAARPELLPRPLFFPAACVCVAIAIAAALAVTADLGLARGNSYLGWGGDLLIAASFLGFLSKREGVSGQSFWIAVTRMLGSWAIIPAQEIEVSLAFVRVVYVSTSVLNLTYLCLYVRKCRALGIHPLRRL
jgi:hypothetical protein